MDNNMMSKVLVEIELSNEVEHLHQLRDRVHNHKISRPFFFDLQEDVEQTNHMHDLMIKRTIYLSEQMLVNEGLGTPPVPYAFVLFGSGGRKEQTLWSDQDNGIIYSLSVNDDVSLVSTYFDALSTMVVANLEKAGYPPCEGNVICLNSQWRKSIDAWEQTIAEWFDDAHWEHVRQLLIAVDGRCIYGDEQLLDRLKTYYFRLTSEQPEIFSAMLKNTLRYKILLGVFGNLIKEQYGEDAGGIDIKYGAYIPFINGIRLLAIYAGIKDTSTLERIGQLAVLGHLDELHVQRLKKAFESILKLRSFSSHQVENGVFTSTGKLKAKLLTRDLIDQLKYSLKVGKELQKWVQKKTALLGRGGKK